MELINNNFFDHQQSGNRFCAQTVVIKKKTLSHEIRSSRIPTSIGFDDLKNFRKWIDQGVTTKNRLHQPEVEREKRRHRALHQNDGPAKLAVAIRTQRQTEVVPFVVQVKITVREGHF